MNMPPIDGYRGSHRPPPQLEGVDLQVVDPWVGTLVKVVP